MEVIVTLVWLVYHDASCIRLKLEIADAVKFYVSHHVWKEAVGILHNLVLPVGCMEYGTEG